MNPLVIKSNLELLAKDENTKWGVTVIVTPLLSVVNRLFLNLVFLLEASLRVGSRSEELKQGLALRSLNRLLPGILKAYRAVLELLTYDLDVLVVLLAVCPVLLVLHAVATCALELLHVLTVDGVLELH